ncbi:hypothetical protein [Pseudomonas viridiflava]|uniref:hypothetical protein n=3 Tax=Pseudomonas viridiflava TaxID=33069 RepID=UPI000F0138E9|nr:hypothetical protein [Pseudomonas viridiflava]
MSLPIVSGVKIEPKFFSKHSWNADLIDFEGPLLSLYRGEFEEDLLYIWLDCNATKNRWGVVPVSRASLRGYLDCSITLRKVFEASSWIAIFHTGSAANRRNSPLKTHWQNLLDYLPEEGSYLVPEIATEAARRLAGETTVEYPLGLDGDMYIDDIAAIPKIYQQLYSFHYGLEYLHRPAVRGALDRLASNWTGGFSAVHLFTGLNQVTPSIHRAQVTEMRYNSPGHIKLDLLPQLAKRIETSAKQIQGDKSFQALEDFYSSTYRYFKENKISGFDDEKDSASLVLSPQITIRLSELVAFFFRLMCWEDYRERFGELQVGPLHQLRALLAYYRRLRKLRPYVITERLELGRSKLG